MCTKSAQQEKSEKTMREAKKAAGKEKIPKGYRLKVSTHNKIKELQNKTNSSQDMVITRAIRLYMKQLNAV